MMEVFWPLFGIRSAEPFSATETEFALLKLLSSTNSVPVFIDEYKPFDMPKHRRHTLHRYMRRLYTGEVESRGRADQTVVSYRLHAPLCLAGETRPIESALVERIVTANPSKDTLPEHPQFIRAFQKLKTVDLGLLTRSIVRHLLESGGRTVKTGLDYFLEILSSLAVSGGIQHNRQYTYSSGQLALHVASCHAAYAEHCRRVGYEGEVLDKKALVRQLQENQRRGGYVVDVSRPVSFGSRADKRRAAFIDLEAVKRLLDVDDFPRETWGVGLEA